jgi:GntR family transcriptional repressor for pyruvate dehydrogenase complex
MPQISEPIVSNTLVENVTLQLRQMISEGRVKVGEYFPPQREMATQFGVGLSTVREAFQKLAAMGLVTSHPGKGTWVTIDHMSVLMDPMFVKTRLGELHARQVSEARSVVEVALTKFAASRATPEDLQRIQAALQAMERAQNDQDFVDADLDFHLSVAAAGHNELLEQFYHLTRQLLAEIIAEMVMLPEVKEKSIKLQWIIAQAIVSSDVEKAQWAALEHMRYIEELLNAYE